MILVTRGKDDLPFEQIRPTHPSILCPIFKVTMCNLKPASSFDIAYAISSSYVFCFFLCKLKHKVLVMIHVSIIFTFCDPSTMHSQPSYSPSVFGEQQGGIYTHLI